MRDNVTRQCPQTTTLEEKGELKHIRTEVLLLTSLTPYRLAKPAHGQGHTLNTSGELVCQRSRLGVVGRELDGTLLDLSMACAFSSSSSTGDSVMIIQHQERLYSLLCYEAFV